MKTQSLVIVLVMAGCLSGCAAPWDTTRAGVRSAANVIDNIEPLMDEGSRLQGAFHLLSSSLASGYDLIDVWEQAGQKPEDWHLWAAAVLRSTARVFNVIKNSGREFPNEIFMVLESIEALLPTIMGF